MKNFKVIPATLMIVAVALCSCDPTIESAAFVPQPACGCATPTVTVTSKNAREIRMTAPRAETRTVDAEGKATFSGGTPLCANTPFTFVAVSNMSTSPSRTFEFGVRPDGEMISLDYSFTPICQEGRIVGYTPIRIPEYYSENFVITSVSLPSPPAFHFRVVGPDAGSRLAGATFNLSGIDPAIYDCGAPQGKTDTFSTRIYLAPPIYSITITATCNAR